MGMFQPTLSMHNRLVSFYFFKTEVIGNQGITLTAKLITGKDIVFRFIIEYSSLMDFYRPLLGNNNRSIFI
jgi:hypothetical protein